MIAQPSWSIRGFCPKGHGVAWHNPQRFHALDYRPIASAYSDSNALAPDVPCAYLKPCLPHPTSGLQAAGTRMSIVISACPPGIRELSHRIQHPLTTDGLDGAGSTPGTCRHPQHPFAMTIHTGASAPVMNVLRPLMTHMIAITAQKIDNLLMTGPSPQPPS